MTAVVADLTCSHCPVKIEKKQTTTEEKYARIALISLIFAAAITLAALSGLQAEFRRFFTHTLPHFWNHDVAPILATSAVRYVACALAVTCAIAFTAYVIHRYRDQVSEAKEVTRWEDILKRVLSVLETVTLVGLAIYSAYTDTKLFFGFFVPSIALGIYLQHRRMKQAQTECGGDGSSGGPMCAGGFLSDLTHVKLPPPMPLLINAAITWEHVGHHSKIFVPIIAINVGVWVGSLATHYVHYKEGCNPCYTKI